MLYEKNPIMLRFFYFFQNNKLKLVPLPGDV